MGSQSERPLRGAVIGLGMIGRPHTRLLQDADRVEFAGAVDPAGDRYRSVHDGARVFDSVAALLADGPLDLPVPAARELVAAGVSVLIEKPLAATVESAREIVRLAAADGVHGAVGHVERFNVALQEMHRRIVDGQLGRLYAVST